VTRRLIARFVADPVASTWDDLVVPAAGDPVAPASPDPRVLERITGREHEVFLLVAEGLSNQEIAARLHITAGTAKTHVAHLLAKLDARDRIHLVILAHRSGLVG